jgi:hypothetical protein
METRCGDSDSRVATPLTKLSCAAASKVATVYPLSCRCEVT